MKVFTKLFLLFWPVVFQNWKKKNHTLKIRYATHPIYRMNKTTKLNYSFFHDIDSMHHTFSCVCVRGKEPGLKISNCLRWCFSLPFILRHSKKKLGWIFNEILDWIRDDPKTCTDVRRTNRTTWLLICVTTWRELKERKRGREKKKKNARGRDEKEDKNGSAETCLESQRWSVERMKAM